MICIIDANNLAGRFGILEEPDFDKRLVEIVGDYFSKKEMEAFLVFDSNDPMGDKYIKEGVNVITAPRGNAPYSCADDKIVEIIAGKIENGEAKDEITVVTDDNGLKDKIMALAEKSGLANKVHLLSCSAFIERVDKVAEGVNDDFFDEEKISVDDEQEINEELRDLWD